MTELKKVETNEFRWIIIFLLYTIIMFLLIISMLGAISYFANENIILTFLGISFVICFGWICLIRFKKLMLKENSK